MQRDANNLNSSFDIRSTVKFYMTAAVHYDEAVRVGDRAVYQLEVMVDS